MIITTYSTASAAHSTSKKRGRGEGAKNSIRKNKWHKQQSYMPSIITSWRNTGWGRAD